MSENTEFETPNEVDSAANDNTPLSNLTWPELRKLATTMGIKWDKTWTRNDYETAVNNRRNKHQSLVDIVFDSGTKPKPGFARILIHNSQTGSNHPVPVAVNNYIAKIPRDTEVDVPLEVIEALKNSKTPVRVKDTERGINPETGKHYLKWKDVPSYPFQVIDYTAGTATRNGVPLVRSSSNKSKHAMKLKFREIYERWPKREELAKFQDQHMKAKAAKAIAAEEVTES